MGDSASLSQASKWFRANTNEKTNYVHWCPSTVEQGRQLFGLCSFVASKCEERIFFFFYFVSIAVFGHNRGLFW